MRPWDTFSAREADEYDYAGLADALKPDRNLLNHHYWREDLRKQYGQELDNDALNRHAELASAVLGVHPDFHSDALRGRTFPWTLNQPSGRQLALADTVETPRSNSQLALASNPGATTFRNDGLAAFPRASAIAVPYAARDRGVADEAPHDATQSTPDWPFQLAAAPPKSGKVRRFVQPPVRPGTKSQSSPEPPPDPPIPFWVAPLLYGLKLGQGFFDALSGSRKPLEWHTAQDRMSASGFRKGDYRLVRDYLKEVAPNYSLTQYHATRGEFYEPPDEEFDEIIKFLANVHDAARRAEKGDAPLQKGLTYRRADVGTVRTYVSDDLFDPHAVFDGVSNLERISRGHSPIGNDGVSKIVIHHLGQNQNIAVELTEEAHRRLSRYLHTNPRSMPSNIFRPATDRDKEGHWRQRANEISNRASRR